MTTKERQDLAALAQAGPPPANSAALADSGAEPADDVVARPSTGKLGATSVTNRISNGFSRVWFLAAALILWWVLSSDSTSTFFPPLRDIVIRLYELWIVGDTKAMLWPSLTHFVIGYVSAGVLGVLLGALLWRFRRTNDAVSPLLYFIYVIPAPAILPAVIAVMGIESGMKITIIVLAAVWPTMLNTIDGMSGIDPIKLDTAKVLHMSPLHTVRSVVLPGAMPQIMAGLRHSLQIAVIMMVVSELVASTSGIGFFILDAQQRFAFTDMWTGIVVLALIGSALTFLFVAIERVVLAWYIGARAVEEKG